MRKSPEAVKKSETSLLKNTEVETTDENNSLREAQSSQSKAEEAQNQANMSKFYVTQSIHNFSVAKKSLELIQSIENTLMKFTRSHESVDSNSEFIAEKDRT